MNMNLKKCISEFLGTALLVLLGCGTASICSSYVGTLGIAFSFGLALIASGTIISDISGNHINPAVSLAMYIDKRISLKELGMYVLSQVLGALFGAFLLSWIITSANIGNISSTGLGANGYAKYSSVGLSLSGAILVEVILTFIFVLVVLRSTENKNNNSLFIIGLTLILVHIIGIPLTGTSVNPARSLAPALLLKGDALKQVWVFIIAPLLGAILAALLNRFVLNNSKKKK